jgi:uncharacterized membrane protein YjgN (DUF898 family)
MASSLPNAALPWPFPLQPVAEAGEERVRAEGPGLAGLAWRGSALTIVTLGIYRFWYKTDLRRWYWRHTVVAGSAFEYRGTGRELLLGFLFALAVLVPIYLVVALGSLFASEVAGIALNVLFAFIFLLLVQYGAYRSRRYRLTRTVWRGLRFDQTGSAWAYAGLSFAWLLPTILTLGLTFPLMRRSLEGYRMRHTRFGTAQGRFAAPAWPLMRAWLFMTGPLVGCLVLLGLGLALLADGRGENDSAALGATAGGVLGVLAAFWAVLLWPYYRIREFRIFAEATAIGPATFRSEARIGAAYAIHVKFMLIASVCTSALGIVVAAIAAVAAGGLAQLPSGGTQLIIVLAALAPAYLGGVLMLGVLKELFLNRPTWQLLAGTLTVRGLDHLGEVGASAVSDEAATGEGFSDALDFGGV